jgi:hypothetical protein
MSLDRFIIRIANYVHKSQLTLIKSTFNGNVV